MRGCPPAVLFDPCCTPVAPAAPRLRTSRAGASRWPRRLRRVGCAGPSAAGTLPVTLFPHACCAASAGASRWSCRPTPFTGHKGWTECAWAPFTGRQGWTRCAWAPFTGRKGCDRVRMGTLYGPHKVYRVRLGLKGWTGLCARPPLVWELYVDRVGLASASCRPRRTCWEPAVVAWRIRAGRTKLFRRPLQVSAPLTPAALAQPEPARLCTNTSANACPARGPHGMPWGRTPCHVSTRRNTTELPVRSMGRWWFLSGARGVRGAAGAVLSSRRGDRERPCRMWHCSPLLDFPGAPRPVVLLVGLVVQWDTHTTQYSVLGPNAAAPERIRPRGHFAAVPARENCKPLSRCGY